MTELNGNSLARAEREGWRVLLNILGVVSDITGVVKESFFGAGVVNDVMALLTSGLLVGGVSIFIMGGWEEGTWEIYRSEECL